LSVRHLQIDGRKVRGAIYFTKAEHYVADPEAGNYVSRALSALDTVAEIGDDGEREATGDILMAAAAQSRTLQAAQGNETVLIATTNAKHLERYVDAREWTAI